MKSDIFEKYHIFWSKNAFLAKYKRRKLLLVSTLHISRRYLHSFASIHMNSTCTYVYWARVDCNHFRSKLLSIIYSLFAKSATCLQTDQTREKKKESTKITYTHNSTTHFLLILLRSPRIPFSNCINEHKTWLSRTLLRKNVDCNRFAMLHSSATLAGLIRRPKGPM